MRDVVDKNGMKFVVCGINSLNMAQDIQVQRVK